MPDNVRASYLIVRVRLCPSSKPPQGYGKLVASSLPSCVLQRARASGIFLGNAATSSLRFRSSAFHLHNTPSTPAYSTTIARQDMEIHVDASLSNLMRSQSISSDWRRRSTPTSACTSSAAADSLRALPALTLTCDGGSSSLRWLSRLRRSSGKPHLPPHSRELACAASVEQNPLPPARAASAAWRRRRDGPNYTKLRELSIHTQKILRYQFHELMARRWRMLTSAGCRHLRSQLLALLSGGGGNSNPHQLHHAFASL